VKLLPPGVNEFRGEPSALAKRMGVSFSLRWVSMTAWVCVQATSDPSAEGMTPPTVLTCIENSGVQAVGACASAVPANAANSHERVISGIIPHGEAGYPTCNGWPTRNFPRRNRDFRQFPDALAGLTIKLRAADIPMVLDHEQLRSITLYDEELMRELLQALIDDTSTQLTALEAAMGAADGGRLARLAHSCKGACANL